MAPPTTQHNDFSIISHSHLKAATHRQSFSARISLVPTLSADKPWLFRIIPLYKVPHSFKHYRRRNYTLSIGAAVSLINFGSFLSLL